MNRWNYLKSLILYLSLILTISACGGGGGDDDDPEPTSNRAPTAEDISVTSNINSPYINIKLIGNDPDNDTLSYSMEAASDGSGYERAFVNPNTGDLYAILKDDGTDTIVIPYKVTDGSLFSNVAEVTISIGELEGHGTGANEIPAEEYGRLELAFFDGERFGSTLGDDPSLPASIDLSGNFPQPGNQGTQGSCVGWATGYALKSYHEKVEEQWAFSEATVFSPAWIYNQINGGVDQGSRIDEALQLIIDRGAATWGNMPYDNTNFTRQPSQQAIAQAANYKAREYRSITSTQQIKAALANRNPVVAGILVYDDLQRLSGPNSVYNSTTGEPSGGHAVTLVGYDDNKYGGAFKIINSWGTGWGDNGFFWLPYTMVGRVMSQALVLTDGANTGENTDDDVDPVVPPTDGDLPNLEIVQWQLNYDTQAGGQGTWQWEVINGGTADAPMGADVNLMLSTDNQIDSSDWYIVYEEIPVTLAPGDSASRDQSNPRYFKLPQNLPPGDYYIATWVDDLQEVEESDEHDNQSFGDGQVHIDSSSLPDIAIDYWYAEWDSYGNGLLEYTVYNDGDVPTTRTDWDINLILTIGEDTSQGGYYLFYEHANHILNPGVSVYRDEESPASFNLFTDTNGNSIPSGTYYMSLWVDDQGYENESNEINNLSIGNTQVTLSNSSYRSPSEDQQGTTKKPASDNNSDMQALAFDGAGKNIRHTYNGRRIPDTNVLMAKVKITDQADGTRTMTVLESDKPGSSQQTGTIYGEKRYNKVINSADQAITPRVNRIQMPIVQDTDNDTK
ncbi:MAG: C1 family peptidase [Candidatus Thiodiazotropha lotti]|nr:C1 family peptidase [Candidatus Thiodiazotropha lotti]